MAFSIGAVAYSTFDDSQAPLSGELMNVENPTTYFDVLAEQMARSSMPEASDGITEETRDDPALKREQVAPGIPVNPRTYDTAPAALPVSLPVNQNVMGANSTETFHSGAPRPTQQPQTGAGMLLATILGSVAMLFWQSRGMLKASIE